MSNLRKKININTAGTEIFTNANPGAISDGGGSVTVDGSVSATQSGTWNIGTVTAVTGITNVVSVNDNGSTLSIDDGGNSISIDDGGNELLTIDYAHKEIHEGNHYSACYIFAGVANNASAELRILNGSTKYLHLLVYVNCELKTYSYIYEATTYSGNGTSLSIYNNNRSSAKVSTATVYHTPTVNVLGTEILCEMIPAGSKSTPLGGSSASRLEYILDTSTDYLIRVTSKGGAGSSNDISIICEWYEESV